ncbi:L,D-transpeptidase family protein [Streptomyces amakusaensis]|uniref:L,D-transpeptidase n=1 Tax=Streptomyces amakusaensis TaxID=67271 RepID=A0ABW0AJU4_9ACTN
MRGRTSRIRGVQGRRDGGVRGRPARTALLAAVAAAVAATALTAPPAVAAPEPCIAGTGPYQRQLEGYLGQPVDGVQSKADCEAIQTFQTEHAIDPADGYANLATYRWTVALAARANPNAAGDCPVRSYRVTCVDLDRQLLWVQRGSGVVFEPVPIRTGRDTEETRLGWHSIYWRSRDHVSTIYDDAPMPYAQFFDGGQALHGRLDDLYDGGGSAGCVNLRLADAEALWNLLDIDDQLYIWGVKPGTDG